MRPKRRFVLPIKYYKEYYPLQILYFFAYNINFMCLHIFYLQFSLNYIKIHSLPITHPHCNIICSNVLYCIYT